MHAINDVLKINTSRFVVENRKCQVFLKVGAGLNVEDLGTRIYSGGITVSKEKAFGFAEVELLTRLDTKGPECLRDGVAVIISSYGEESQVICKEEVEHFGALVGDRDGIPLLVEDQFINGSKESFRPIHLHPVHMNSQSKSIRMRGSLSCHRSVFFPHNFTITDRFHGWYILVLSESERIMGSSEFVVDDNWKLWKDSNSQTKKLPPGPWKLPIIGNMHHVASGPPHHVFRELAKKYGPLMHLQLGEFSSVVVTSSELAKQVLKTHDLAFASRPKLMAMDIVFYNRCDIAFSPYGEYWRQMRKICVMELLSAKNVRSFSSIRNEEAILLIDSIRSSSFSGEPVNFTESIIWFTSSMTCRSAFGRVLKEQDKFIKLIGEVIRLAGGFDVADIFPSYKFLHSLSKTKKKLLDVHQQVDSIVEDIINERKKNLATTHKGDHTVGDEDLIDVLLRVKKDRSLEFPITNNNIKAIIIDMFGAGTETSSTTTVWAMAEMMKTPSVFAKAQAEVREAFRDNVTFDVEELKYLKLVVKETLRLHPPVPLLTLRECMEETNLNDYTIPLKTKVMVNVWAIGRDPRYWDDAESFKPERFEQCSVDFNGNNFEYLPFGSGRRICPGISFGLANVYLPLAQLLYHFDWKLPTGMEPSDLDLTESAGVTSSLKNDLYLIATPYQP
ncbi:Cytochrome 71D6 [Capsicum chinense]|nr:Cytochrome 71D6 [Capsicum chinense]